MDTTTTTITEDKTVAILSYLTLIGLIVALVMHGNRKTKLGTFHLRQSLGLFLTIFAFGIAQFGLILIPILGWLAIFVMYVALFVFWVLGLIAAIKGEMKPLPVIGDFYQSTFGTAFN